MSPLTPVIVEIDTPVDLVLDTNVMVEIYSDADLWEAAARTGPWDLIAASVVEYRRNRARESLLLAMLLHERRLTTLSLYHEVIKVITRLAPPGDTKAWHSYLFAYFAREHLLFGWRAGTRRDADLGLKNRENDELVLEWTVERGVPLITREGNKPDSLRHKASARNVDAFSPGVMPAL